MTASQWVFSIGLLVLIAAVAVIGTLAWQQRRSPNALLGFAFAVIAVVSTINLTLVGHWLRVYIDSNDAEIERQLQCDDKLINALRVRDQILASAFMDGGSVVDLPAIPKC